MYRPSVDGKNTSATRLKKTTQLVEHPIDSPNANPNTPVILTKVRIQSHGRCGWYPGS